MAPSHHHFIGGMFTISKWVVYGIVLPTLLAIAGWFEHGKKEYGWCDDDWGSHILGNLQDCSLLGIWTAYEWNMNDCWWVYRKTIGKPMKVEYFPRKNHRSILRKTLLGVGKVTNSQRVNVDIHHLRSDGFFQREKPPGFPGISRCHCMLTMELPPVEWL